MYEKIKRIRVMIHEEADKNPAVGKIEESLKWGHPSFSSDNRSATPIRLAMEKKSPGTFGLYVHCNTRLIGMVRDMYGDLFQYDGNRGILFDADNEIPEDAIRHVINMALTYHVHKP